MTDYDGDGEISEAESHRFNDEELDGRYFSPWTSYSHPQFGAVEIGGWHAKFWGQNPPPEFLEAETEQQMPWILYLAGQSPLIEVTDPVVTDLGDGTFRVDVTVSNAGFLPTSLTDRGVVGNEGPDGTMRNQVVRPPAVTLQHPGLEIIDGTARRVVGHLAGSNPFLQGAMDASRSVSWIVRPTGEERAVRVTAASDKGGTVRSGWARVR